jgi:hypothetical protein
MPLATRAQQPVPTEGEKIGRYADLMTLPPEMQAPTYRHMEQLYPTRVVKRGAVVHPLPAGEPVEVKYSADGQLLDIGAFMARNKTAGLLAIKDGKVVLERYAMGNTAQTKWLSASCGGATSGPDSSRSTSLPNASATPA